MYLKAPTRIYKLAVLLTIITLFSFSACKQDRTATDTDQVVSSIYEDNPSAALQVLEGKLRNLGTIYEHDLVPVSFVLHNTGKLPIKIVAAVLYCPCGEIKEPPENLELPPGEEYQLNVNLSAQKMKLGKFSRSLSVMLNNEQFIPLKISGHIEENIKVLPGRVIDIGVLTDSAQPWERDIPIVGVNRLEDKLQLAEDPKSSLFNLELKELQKGTYSLKISSKHELPYTQGLRHNIILPIVSPAGLLPLKLNVTGQVGEAIRFFPAAFSFAEDDFIQSESLLRSSGIGALPDEIYELPSRDKELAKKTFFVLSPPKTISNIDWLALFENLEFDSPAGVKVEKELHPAGIALRLLIEREAFAQRKRVEITPYRGKNKFNKISFTLDSAE